MMKKNISIFLFVFITISSFAQYSNSWINYSQKYYKFPISKTGVYRITYSDLTSAGVSISSINSPKNFQIFGRGEEVAIYVNNESSGIFSASDYIEFYAEKNDGWYDYVLYGSPADQPNTNYSLFTDTAYYYFTYNTSVNNKRLQIVDDNNFSAYTPSDYFMYNSRTFYNQEYIEGEKLTSTTFGGTLISDPEYSNGEGWYSYAITLGNSSTKNLSTKNVYQNGPAAIATFEVMGNSDFNSGSNDNHHSRIEIGNKTIDTTFSSYTRLIFSETIQNSSLGNSTTDFIFSSVDDINSGADRIAIPYINMLYAHTLDLENASEFYMNIDDASAQTKSYYNFTNFNGGNDAFVYDLDNNIKVNVVKDVSNYKVLIPNSGGSKKCFISNSNNLLSVSNIAAVSATHRFTNVLTQNPNADYIIISHASLMGVGSTKATANDYANYRDSKGQSSLVVDIEDLYHQFSYGIRKNPMAIKNFIKAMGGTYGFESFDGLFIIGKSYRSTLYRKNPSLFNGTLVPTFGNPPSDILLVSGLIDNLYTPAIPIGRLSAKSLDHVDLYLDKIMLNEDENQFPYDLWMKKILHFSGGSNAGEQFSISNYLHSYQEIAEDTLFGANVLTFYKSTTDPIQINLSDLIKYHVNNGVSLMTFFGHAAGIGFDISIDDPSDYDNYGKYPILLANSCLAGDIFQYTNGEVNSAEEFVLIRDKGMIAYIGSVTQMTMPPLNTYSTSFYNQFSASAYGESIGSIIKNIIETIQNTQGRTKEVCLEMTLHGDPLVKFRSTEKPDYSIDETSVFYSPEIVSTAVDSFDYNLVIKNIGRSVSDSIIVEVNRKYAIGDSLDKVLLKIPSPKYIDTISIRLPVNRAYGIGDNIISTSVDSYNNVDEENESNNIISTILNIKAADLSPVFPAEFAIVDNESITLKASTYYPFTSLLDYVFEVDTSAYFSSPIKTSTKIQSAGGVLQWELPFNLVDSTVYFWRVSLDSNAQHNYNWRYSSFEYINGKNGWSQANFMQFKNNDYQFTKFIENERTFKFVDDIKLVKAQTGTYPYLAWTEIFLQENSSRISTWACTPSEYTGGVKIFVINPVTAEFWMSKNIGGEYGIYNNMHCAWYDLPSYDYPTEDVSIGSGIGLVKDTVWYQRIADFIAVIPDGHKVLAMSYNNAKVNLWPEYLYQAFDSIGSSNIRNLQDGMPFILYGEKGAIGVGNEISGANVNSVIQLNDSIKSNWNEGQISTKIIGPSQKWSSLNWKQHSQENISTDSVRLRLIGVRNDGSEQTIIDGLHSSVESVSTLNDLMPASEYPYCKLVSVMRDDVNRSPAYMDSWRVEYVPVAEIAIDPLTHYEFYSDTLMQGDSLKFQIAYKNIGNVDMDSLLVKTWIKDAQGEIIPLSNRRLSPVAADGYIVDTIEVSTMSLLGQCFLFVEINPKNESTGAYDQLEITHSNNSGDIPFFVQGDKENPLLDVTFDGVHILNGDLVSSRPMVRITLKDESKFMAINDTSLFKVRVKAIEDNDYTTVNFNDPNNALEFIPAQLPDNSAEVIYSPELDDGEYQLLVYANDASSNKSGDNGYKIDFTVVNKSTITNMMNWPNPFSDRTHFVFTLTGSQLPDYLKIQIMTVTGKLIREIDGSELGDIHIGRNITDYAWDGKDEFGDQLANGVYLYRVTTRINGESIEHRDSGADKYFKQSFGKMYLMR